MTRTTLIFYCLFTYLSTVYSGCLPLSCNCGLGSGEDICTNSRTPCAPLVVRPLELAKPLAPPLLPLKNPCSCSSSVVKPAYVPKPACSCSAQVTVQNSANQQSNQVQWQISQPAPVIIEEVNKNPAHYIPADPVSLSVAYKLSQESCPVYGEDKLSFGFRQLPKELPPAPKKKTINIPEESLFNLNGQIVELKKVAKCSRKQSLDEEAIEELLALADEEIAEEAQDVKKISLGEIGYGPAKIPSASFVDLPALPANPIEDLVETLVENAPKPCNDGFRPGNAIVSEIPCPGPIALPPPPPEPCDSLEVSYLGPPPAVLPLPASNPFSLVASSSSASSSNSNAQKFVLQNFRL